LSRKRNAVAPPKWSSLLYGIIAISPTLPKQESGDDVDEVMDIVPIVSSEEESTDIAHCVQQSSEEDEVSGPSLIHDIDVAASTECSLSQTQKTGSHLVESYLSQHPAAVLQGATEEVVPSLPVDGRCSSATMASKVVKHFAEAYAALSPGRRAQCNHWLRSLAIYLRPRLFDDPTGMIQHIISDNPMGAIEELKNRLGVSSVCAAPQDSQVHERHLVDETGDAQLAVDKVLLREETFQFNCPAMHGLREHTSRLSGTYCCDYCGQDNSAHESFLICESCDVGVCSDCRNNEQCCRYESCHGCELTRSSVYCLFLSCSLFDAMLIGSSVPFLHILIVPSHCGHVIFSESFWLRQPPGCFLPRAASSAPKLPRNADQLASLTLKISSRSGSHAQGCSGRRRSSTPSSEHMMPVMGATLPISLRG